MFTLKGWLLVLMGTVIGSGVPSAVAAAKFPDALTGWAVKALVISFVGSIVLVQLLSRMAPEERRNLFLKS